MQTLGPSYGGSPDPFLKPQKPILRARNHSGDVEVVGNLGHSTLVSLLNGVNPVSHERVTTQVAWPQNADPG